MHYYNEIDPFAAAWLRTLIAKGLIPDGTVDERSVTEVRPADLHGYQQCHFFAGIGGWPLALQLAGWPGGHPVWTGSCPCQPFSVAGRGQGENDDRHLWPAFRTLIGECQPPIVFGEQVAGANGLAWLDGVRADLEALDYAVGAADLCAAGIGAPHIRQRLYWVAESKHSERRPIGFDREDEQHGRDGGRTQAHGEPGARGEVRRVAQSGSQSARRVLQRSGESGGENGGGASGESGGPGGAGWVGHAHPTGSQRWVECNGSSRELPVGAASAWSSFDVIGMLDGKARRIEPGTFPLANGVPARVGRLRGYGNAIVPQLAAEFIQAFVDCRTPQTTHGHLMNDNEHEVRAGAQATSNPQGCERVAPSNPEGVRAGHLTTF